MVQVLPESGAASPELMAFATQCWTEAAATGGIDLTGFDPKAPLEERILWARGRGLSLGAVYTRYSTPKQRSTRDQVRSCVEFAVARKVFVSPEFISMDEGKSGRKARRDGLLRLRATLQQPCIEVFLTFMLSRLFRTAHQCYRFVDEEIVERGIRAICVADGIDTFDKSAWKFLVSIKGAIDEAQIETTAEQVRNAQIGLFREGFLTGALPVGFRRRIVPEARLTNRGLPRAVAEVAPEAAGLIRQHLAWLADGMPITEGWRRWVTAGGPCDPRATGGRMGLESYRRMISSEKLIGVWKFGQKRSSWSSKRDYTRQVIQPESAVKVARHEHLRIVDDELFFKVQERLGRGTRGRHKTQRKTGKPVMLWDLVTDLFHCPHCQHRFQQTGGDGHSMACADDLCSHPGMVRRREAVHAILVKLGEILIQDHELIDRITSCAITRDGQGDEEIRKQISEELRQVEKLGRKIDLLVEMASDATTGDQEEQKVKIRLARQERATHQARMAQLQAQEKADRKVLTAEEAHAILADFRSLLAKAGSAEAEPDAVYKAAEIFRSLVGGKILVYFEKRPGRKRTVARATFRPQLLRVVAERAGVSVQPGANDESPEVSVWLREPPTSDQVADEVKRLWDDGQGYRAIAQKLGVSDQIVWTAFRRWHEMRNLSLPARRYNNGQRRKHVA